MDNQGLATGRYSSPGRFVGMTPTLLIVGPVEDDYRREPVFDQFGWPAHRVRNCLDVALHLHGSSPHVLVCDRNLVDCDWKEVLEVTASRPNPPPVIITSRHADEYLWAEVLNLGGFDVLTKPLDQQEVRRVLSFAWDHWADQAYPAKRHNPAPARKGELTTCSAA
jgi:DNA-binding NtrC family response regulator